MEPYLADPDFDLYVGDVREVLSGLPDSSVDCVVTSPPYWGLRDYGTASWEGGDSVCDHVSPRKERGEWPRSGLEGGLATVREQDRGNGIYREFCGKCGAARVDDQVGLEATPDLYVAAMVEVFREVRRVLADRGTLWLNLGDSYNAAGREGHGTRIGAKQGTNRASAEGEDRPSDPTLKPKDIAGIPWRVAFALQADGWYLRSDIIWAKPNPMPESVTDRPTKSHEYVFLLSKRPRYYFDQEAVREAFETKYAPGSRVNETQHYGVGNGGNGGLTGQLDDVKARLRAERLGDQPTLDESLPPEAERGPDGRRQTHVEGGDGSIQHRDGERWPNGGRNIRSVWEITTQPYPEAHFATFPEELPRRCIAAGCPEFVCATCGEPRERILLKEGESSYETHRRKTGETWHDLNDRHREQGKAVGGTGKNTPGTLKPTPRSTQGWSDCGHGNYRPGTVLDPFMGSGTTALVARKLGRRSVGVELNPEYAALCATRLQQQSLFA